MEFQTLSFYKTLRIRLVLTFSSYLRIFLFIFIFFILHLLWRFFFCFSFISIILLHFLTASYLHFRNIYTLRIPLFHP